MCVYLDRVMKNPFKISVLEYVYVGNHKGILWRFSIKISDNFYFFTSHVEYVCLSSCVLVPVSSYIQDDNFLICISNFFCYMVFTIMIITKRGTFLIPNGDRSFETCINLKDVIHSLMKILVFELFI